MAWRNNFPLTPFWCLLPEPAELNNAYEYKRDVLSENTRANRSRWTRRKARPRPGILSRWRVLATYVCRPPYCMADRSDCTGRRPDCRDPHLDCRAGSDQVAARRTGWCHSWHKIVHSADCRDRNSDKSWNRLTVADLGCPLHLSQRLMPGYVSALRLRSRRGHRRIRALKHQKDADCEDDQNHYARQQFSAERSPGIFVIGRLMGHSVRAFCGLTHARNVYRARCCKCSRAKIRASLHITGTRNRY